MHTLHEVPIAAGHSDFKQLIWLTLPLLIVLHIITLTIVVRACGENVQDYLRCSIVEAQSTRSRALRTMSPGLCLLLLLAVVFMVLNLGTPEIYDQNGGCPVDPITRSTSSPVQTGPVYQWFWTCISCITLATTSFMFEKLRSNPLLKRAKSVQHVLHNFMIDASPSLRTIRTWRENSPHTATTVVPSGRRVLYWLLHIPCCIVASGPAFAFVLAQVHVPFGFCCISKAYVCRMPPVAATGSSPSQGTRSLPQF